MNCELPENVVQIKVEAESSSPVNSDESTKYINQFQWEGKFSSPFSYLCGRRKMGHLPTKKG